MPKKTAKMLEVPFVPAARRGRVGHVPGLRPRAPARAGRGHDASQHLAFVDDGAVRRIRRVPYGGNDMIRGLVAAIAAGIALAGCASTARAPARPSQATAVAAAPTPSPVSTAATISGTCTTGVVDVDQGGNMIRGTFVPFPGSAVSAQGPDGYPATAAGGYQLTLTNTGAATAEVNGFSVVFYSGGAETGSDGASTADEFITPGQSLTWTETTKVMDAGQTGAVDMSATCSLVQWTHP